MHYYAQNFVSIIWFEKSIRSNYQKKIRIKSKYFFFNLMKSQKEKY